MTDSEFNDQVRKYRSDRLFLVSCCIAMAIGMLMIAGVLFASVFVDNRPFVPAVLTALFMCAGSACLGQVVVQAINYAQAKDRVRDEIAKEEAQKAKTAATTQ